jgi:putative Ig domain-containing protein
VAAAGLLTATTAAVVAVPATAGASTLDGVATIASPGTANELASGGSATEYTVSLPAQAACSGDTEKDGYHVYSYLVEAGTSITGVTFVNTPSKGYGFVDNTGTYYGAANTAPTTGQIIDIPNDLEFAPLVTKDSVPLDTLLYGKKNKSGAWDAGIACANSSGTLTDYWNTEVTFLASSTDPNKFTWTAVPGSFRITSTSPLPAATIGTAYSDTVAAAGGPTPYKWKATGLPKGLKVGKSTGTIAGTPASKDAVKTYTVTVTVTDHNKPADTATGSFSLTLNAA